MLSQGEILRNSSRTSLPPPLKSSIEEGPSFWYKFSQFATCLIPNFMIRIFAKKETPAQQQAWREKTTLCLLITLACCILAVNTYFMNIFICKSSPVTIFSKIKPNSNVLIANGHIYESDDNFNFKNSTHLFKKNSSACKKAFGKQIVNGKLSESDFTIKDNIYFDWTDIHKNNYIVIDNKVYDPSHCSESELQPFINKYKGQSITKKHLKKYDEDWIECFKDSYYSGSIAYKSNGCIFGDIVLWLGTVIIFGLILIRFFLALFYAWYSRTREVSIKGNTPVILQVACYSEGLEGLKQTLDSLTNLEYDENYKLIIVVADGQIKGAGEEKSTPEILLDICDVEKDVQPMPYISLAPGHKRLNTAKVHTGYYRTDKNKTRIMIINKFGNKNETNKQGNRGKRDSQVILMSFFSKILYKDRMSDLDVEIYKKMSKMFDNFKPEDFEILMMVDADTIVESDALVKMVSAFEKDNKIMGLCGETQISNKTQSWVTGLQVFEYYISHHLAKNFESVFGGVTCLPGCFCIYRIKITTDCYGNIKNHSDKKIYEEKWTCTPILANPSIVNPYSVFEAKTLHEQNLLHLGEDRYLTTLLMKNFYKRKLIFLASAKCHTAVPSDYKTLQSQRRRWINSTVHNMFELVLVDKLCGTNCLSMQFIILFELFGTLTLPAAIFFTGVLLIKAAMGEPAWIPLIMLALILGLPAILIALTTFQLQYFGWLILYIINLPVWNFFLPVYAFWHFDDFSWGDTRKTEGSDNKKDERGEFDSTKINFVELEELQSELAANK